MEAFRWLGVGGEIPPLRFESQPEAARRIQLDLKRPYAVIHPGAVMETKRWSAKNFAEFARAMQEIGLATVLTCGPGEERFVAEVSKDVADSHILIGLSIPALSEVIRGAEIYAGNDSGPMHLAAAVGTPVIALWGSSDSRRWHPWSVRHTVVQNPFECNPCPGYRCLVAQSPLCIESVTVEQAISAAKELMKTHETYPRTR